MLDLLLRIVVLALPVALGISLMRAIERPFASALVTMTLGAGLFVPAAMLGRWLRQWAGLDELGPGSDAMLLVYSFLVVAPLEQAAEFAAFVPAWRTRLGDLGRGGAPKEPIDGMAFAAASALGFASAQGAFYLFDENPQGIRAVLRFASWLPAHVLIASAWGYSLGRDPQRGLGVRGFNLAWGGAAVFTGIYDRIVFGKSFAGLLATLPILAGGAFLASIGVRDLLEAGGYRPSSPSRTRRFLPVIAPPTIQAVREALRRSERPVMLPWIGFGALVTTGVLTASLAGAVVLGRNAGIDFAAVDRPDVTGATAPPLVLLGAAALAAFPVAAYLVARASATRSVLEPAISAALAIAGSLVLLGVASPVAVVFALALAPVAFGLACAGAWFGMAR